MKKMDKYCVSLVGKDPEFFVEVFDSLQGAIDCVKFLGSEAIIYQLKNPLYCHYVDNKLFID